MSAPTRTELTLQEVLDQVRARAEGLRAGAPCLVACDLSTEAGAA